MGGQGSGGHNAAKRPRGAAAPLVQPLPWPWETSDKPWSRDDIHTHLIQYTYESGLSREHLGDIISALASHHWLKSRALATIAAWEARGGLDDEPPQVGGINAYRLLILCDEKIAGDWRRLGVKAQERPAPPAAGETTRRSFRPQEGKGGTTQTGADAEGGVSAP